MVWKADLLRRATEFIPQTGLLEALDLEEYDEPAEEFSDVDS